MRDPDDWQRGWIADPTGPSGPRWSMGGAGLQKEGTAKRPFGGSHKDRDTWINALGVQKSWVPGPGHYRSDREFLLDAKDEVDTNNTIQYRASSYKFGKELKETSLRIKDVKPKRNSATYPKADSSFNPGPGSYTQSTSFGAPSGGHRQSYFGGSEPEATWKSLKRSGL